MRFIELFAGIGGFRLGLEKSNREQQGNTEISGCGDNFSNQVKQPNQPEKWGDYTCVWANDNDNYACQIYRKQFGDRELKEGDTRTVDPSTIPEHDLLTAGFPCQSFSVAGKRRGFQDTRGTLFFEICRIAGAKRTPYLLLENVKGLLSSDNGRTFQTILESLDELGYDCQWQVLNSKDFGVPQNRERVFIIGHLRGQPRPKVFPIGETDQVYTEPDGQFVHAIDSNYHKGWLDNQQRTMIHTAYPGEVREYKDISPTVSTPSGGGHLPMVAQALQTDEQLRQGVSWDTDNPQSSRNIRRLTPLECERLQGFPDNWTSRGIDISGKELDISDTQRYKCLGNAVTVNVIEAIGRQFVKGL